MYNNDELNRAVEKGIFSEQSVKAFREMVASEKQTPATDEENFRLLSGFNDIFVVIACLLSLLSASWIGRALGEGFSLIILPVLSWLLAEFFVRKRKMALPAIVLLLFFVGGVFSSALSLLSFTAEMALPLSAGIATIAAYLHWRRFMVPITIAAGTAAAAATFIFTVIYNAPLSPNIILTTIFLAGVSCFFYAMFWDMRDVTRTSRNSDVAFWLHLLAAPMIVHPIFSKLGILNGGDSIISMLIIAVLYLLMTTISLVIDRRAFMVSSLLYVLYALSNLLESYGVVGYSFAVTGLCIGCALLLLSAFWQKARKFAISFLPTQLSSLVPQTKE